MYTVLNCMPSFGGEVKPSVPCRRFAACKRPLRSWFGHVQRMPDTRTVKKIFKWNPLTKISQGRPKYRWEDNIKQDICHMKVKNWITCVQDRGKWREVVEKDKPFYV